jgi:flagellar FliJ protein
MRQSKRLQPVCDFKQRQEDEAAKRLAATAQEVSQQKQRLSDLENYRGEYDQQFHQASSQGISAQRMRDYHTFMGNLTKVLDQQKAAISVLEKEYEEKKRQWLAARNRAKALNKVQTNYQQQEEMQEEKRQQKEQDDRSSRSVRH